MRTITLKSAWTYRTPQKTINYPAGDHEVTNTIAEQAEAEGVIGKESDGGAKQPAETGTTSSTGSRKG
jgi:hypothetical protein